MPSQVSTTVTNNFTKGFVTEFTGLNFPENAATDTDNCEYTLVGDVVRRLGIDYEENGDLWGIDRTNKAVNTYKWNNAGGDGNTQVVAVQEGPTLVFWKSSSATATNPLSTQVLPSTVSISAFAVAGTFDSTKEAQFADGNGYLFVYHPDCDPFYCTYDAGVVTGNVITLQIRDFTGVPEAGIGPGVRPATLSNEHLYNLTNQGWNAANPWTGISSTTVTVGTGSKTFTIQTGLTIPNGTGVTIYNTVFFNSPEGFAPPYVGAGVMSGTVTGYVSGTGALTVNVSLDAYTGGVCSGWQINPADNGRINTWFTSIGNYPSNSDVWWYYRDNTGAYNPASTLNNVTASSGNAPRGHYVLSPFIQQRSLISANPGITDIVTTVRPKTGCWFQGRVWYAGADAQQPATGNAPYTTWTENIYFSQIVHDVTQMGNCYQVNDPTSETLFDLLPTDGGVIQIQGCGSVYKLFPIQNGMLVFAATGIWFITGSQGIGFSANDYTITKISAIESISSTSFVNVQGLPYFWNEDGIYTVTPSQQGGLSVQSITYSTIDGFYADIPTSSKMYARGDYDPVNYVLKWIYKDTEAVDVTDRYAFNKILNFNTSNKAFFPYTIDNSPVSINGINYITNPGGINNTPSMFKYLATNLSAVRMTFADDHDTNYVDWASVSPVDFESYFITGYKLHGDALRRFQIPYIYVFSRNEMPTQYKIQGIWDYAITGDSGRWSTSQIARVWSPNFGMVFRRHKIRGNGIVLQIKIKSVSREPFDIMGWSTFETVNQGI